MFYYSLWSSPYILYAIAGIRPVHFTILIVIPDHRAIDMGNIHTLGHILGSIDLLPKTRLEMIRLAKKITGLENVCCVAVNRYDLIISWAFQSWNARCRNF